MAKVGLRGIKVVEANFKDNNLQATEFTLAPKLTRRISVGDDVHFILRLDAALHSTETQPFPFELECKLDGYFEITEAEGNEAIVFLNTQGTQMLFPHLRALVSSLTATCLVNTVLLPIISVEDFKEID